ncbi:MAG: hypothetical protein HYS13_20590 [Planctomycetia bacterium]|nr:hypothetical protein [Planctomycetia bacterium]
MAFAATQITSLILLIAVWNGYLSWTRFAFAFRPEFSKNEVTEHLQREQLAEWVESRSVSIPVLGIRVGISDASILGSLTLFITSLWLYFALRRENHEIGTLLRDTREDDVTMRRKVFYAIASRLLFTSVSANDSPISSLGAASQSKTFVVFRFSFKALLWLPFASVLFVLLMDVLSSFVMESPFRRATLPGDNPDAFQYVHLAVTIVFSVVFATLQGIICYHNVSYENGTAQVLQDYKRALD